MKEDDMVNLEQFLDPPSAPLLAAMENIERLADEAYGLDQPTFEDLDTALLHVRSAARNALHAFDCAQACGGADAPFAEWLAKEMPAGTVIGDPAWWADRIARRYSKHTAHQPAAVVDEAMVDRYLAAQAKAVQEIDNKWGNGGKAPSYIHPVREACRAGLTAALAGGAK